MRLWDPLTGEQLGDPLAVEARVHAMVTTVVDGRPVVVTGEWHDRRGRLRVWDLAGRGQTGPSVPFREPVRALAATPRGVLVAGFGEDVAVLTPVRA